MSEQDEDRDEDGIEYSDDFEKEAAKAEPPEDQEDEPEEEDDEPEDQEDESEEEDDEPPAKGKRSARDRIKELAAARRESERAAYEAELRVRELELRLQERGPESAAPEAPKKPDPADFKYGEVDQGYLDAMVDYRVAVREHEREAKTREGSAREKAEAEASKYRERFQKVMAEGQKKYRGFREAVENTVYDPALARMVLDSDNAVDIAYHLSKNVGDLRNLTRASDQERLRMLGRLEGKLSAASAVKKSKSPKTPASGRRKPQKRDEDRYGPVDQDEFDKMFYSR